MEKVENLEDIVCYLPESCRYAEKYIADFLVGKSLYHLSAMLVDKFHPKLAALLACQKPIPAQKTIRYLNKTCVFTLQEVFRDGQEVHVVYHVEESK